MPARHQATVDDLYHFDGDGKAELVNGELVVMSPSGGLHGYAVTAITSSLHEYAKRTGRGIAFGDSVGFLVRLPNRRSFSPDAALHVGPIDRKFIEGAPIFAVEVRSEEDYGPKAEQAMASKRGDYFAAGTLVVWDVDVLRAQCIRVFRASDPESSTIYRRGETAEADSAVPGWTLAVDDIFVE